MSQSATEGSLDSIVVALKWKPTSNDLASLNIDSSNQVRTGGEIFSSLARDGLPNRKRERERERES